jgi:hypothetical protein
MYIMLNKILSGLRISVSAGFSSLLQCWPFLTGHTPD